MTVVDEDEGERPGPALDGRTFAVVLLRIDGSLAPLPEGVHVDARFVDGRVSGTSGCNRYTADCIVEGATIRIGPVATTRMACPSESLAAQEAAYLAALAAAVTWSVSGDRLELRDARGAMQATFVRA